MDQLDRMRIFTKVAELQNFTKAAEQLRLSKASVSTAIKELELHLGARLFQRTTRQVHLMDEGTSYLDRCRSILGDLEESDSMFRTGADQVRGKIRVDMAVSMATRSFLPLLPKFLELYPQVEIELSSSDRTIDLVRDGIDCVIRSGNLDQPGTVSRTLGEAKVINCASPAYLKTFGIPKTLEDLKNHRVIYYAQILGGKRWGFEYFDGKSDQEVKMKGVITVNNTDAYRSACLSGLGIAQIPNHGANPHLKQKELIEVLPELRSEPMQIKIVYPERRLVPARVRTFMNWLEPEIKKMLD